MKYNLAIAFILCISLSGQAQPVPTYKPAASYKLFGSLEAEKLKRLRSLLDSLAVHTVLADGQVVRHAAFISGYSAKHKQPYWVSHILTKDILYGNYTRSDDYRVDSLVKGLTADSLDYRNSGYDRGHMAPAADFRWSKKALEESYFYSNVAPQVPKLNRGAWLKLETLVRQWAVRATELVVVTGPVLNRQFSNLQQGSYQVSIPYYYYKIVADLYPPAYKAIGFLVPNKNVPFNLRNFAVTIDTLEVLTGIDFFPALDDSLENVLERQVNLPDWENDYLEDVDSLALRNYGKDKLNTVQAKDHIGQRTTVCGNVVSVKYMENGKSNPTYINLDKKFPEQQFTIVIYGDVRRAFSYKPEEKLMGKTICVQGKIGQYKEIPQIIVNDEGQIVILE